MEPIIANGKRAAGFTLLSIMFMVLLLHLSMLIALQGWDVRITRDKEAELLWRGKQIKRAIERFYKERKSYPQSLEQLFNLKYLRKEYTDPMVADGTWQYIHPFGSKSYILGVKSRSKGESFYLYENKDKYNEWEFKADVSQQNRRDQRPPGRPQTPEEISAGKPK